MEIVKEIEGHSDKITSIKVNKGKIYSSSFDKTIRIFQVNSWETVGTITLDKWVFDISVEENKLFAGLYDGYVHMFDLSKVCFLITLEIGPKFRRIEI